MQTNYKEELEQYQEEIRTKLIDIQPRMVALNDDILRLSVLVQSGRFYNCIDGLTDDGQKKTIIDDINLSDIRSRLEDGQRASISTKEFEKIIDLLEEKTQDCQRLEEENKKLQQTCEELNR